MGKQNKAASSLQQLDDEIEALKEKARRLELRLDDSWNYFSEHSGQLFVRSLVPSSFEGLLPRTGILLIDKLLESERFQRFVTKLAEKGADRLGDMLNWLSNRVFKNEKE